MLPPAPLNKGYYMYKMTAWRNVRALLSQTQESSAAYDGLAQGQPLHEEGKPKVFLRRAGATLAGFLGEDEQILCNCASYT